MMMTKTTATRMVVVTMVAAAEGMEGEEAGAVVAEGEAGGEAAAAGAAVSIYQETAERNAITSRTEATATVMAARDTSSSPATAAPVVGTRVEATSMATGKSQTEATLVRRRL
jgi:hypothetical protein